MHSTLQNEWTTTVRRRRNDKEQQPLAPGDQAEARAFAAQKGLKKNGHRHENHTVTL
jgi:hypothetical protein